MLIPKTLLFLAATTVTAYNFNFNLNNVFENGQKAILNLKNHFLQNDLNCPRDLLSCKSPSANPCCSPKLGVVVLALQWDLKFGPKNEFTIHGLWPNNCDGSFGPKNGCDKARSVERIADTVFSYDRQVYDQMKKYWPSNRGDDDYFWTHEWNKHGTCVSTIDPKCYDENTFKKGQDIVEYFNTTLALRNKYNLFDALARHNIFPNIPNTPNSLYTLQQFKQAIKAEFGHEPNVRCIGNRLMEIFLYFNVKNKDEYIMIPAAGKDTCRKIRYSVRN
ncbi:Ribonuclease Rh [Smittium culicis]|uniref:ribonuclease T2 n=2 Tax=Smittium culicis TaxID=133412 RepID=A0A1R1Y5L9_9FUNG|nr:Ribonuclease Rh [Smittium culicis]